MNQISRWFVSDDLKFDGITQTDKLRLAALISCLVTTLIFEP